MDKIAIKLTFISGLQNIVLDEIKKTPEIQISYQGKEEIYLDFGSDLKKIVAIRSILNVYIIKQGEKLNPHFISKHKSILGGLIDIALKESFKYKTFKLSCAGSDSKEVREIKRFIASTYKLEEAAEADMELFIGKSNATWEAGVRLTNRPLSLREYKVENIKGGLNPTIAYAMNTFRNLQSSQSYLNIFSGSATLLIEAGLVNKELKLVGFDSNGKSNAAAVQNIKKAELLKSIQLKTSDIFDKPDLGKFDIITSDLPFGMQISKDEDLEKLYREFVEYCEVSLNPGGTLVVYTTEHALLADMLGNSKFTMIQTLDLKVSTVVNAYIYPKIFVCKLRS